jgi:hypothetical protein
MSFVYIHLFTHPLTCASAIHPFASQLFCYYNKIPETGFYKKGDIYFGSWIGRYRSKQHSSGEDSPPLAASPWMTGACVFSCISVSVSLPFLTKPLGFDHEGLLLLLLQAGLPAPHCLRSSYSCFS